MIRGWKLVQSLVRIFSGAVLDGLVIVLLSAIMIFAVYVLRVPDVHLLKSRPISQTTIIYDRTGKQVLYEIHGEENRKIIAHEEIPDLVRFATIAAEDDKFYRHLGFDPQSMFRSLLVNMRENGIRQGASTITQQLARRVFLTQEKTLERKIKEIALALKIERRFPKDEILDMYLNEVPYGANAYGIESAAEIYFGKSASELALDEAALMAAIPKATAYYSPYGNYRDELYFRQRLIIERMAELELVSKTAAREALAVDTAAKVLPFHSPIRAPHFVFFVREELERLVGKEAAERGGFDVITTLDTDFQDYAETVVAEGAKQNETRFSGGNAALIALDPKTGDVRAMVGSRNFFDASRDGEVNVALSPRQPGSSFKPIVYATAFEKGIQPESMVVDARTNFGPDGSGRPYIPRNYSGKHFGAITIRQALAMSLNVPAVKTLAAVGIDPVIGMAQRLGITTLTDRKRYGLSLAIGGAEVTLLEETSAFSVFANDGIRHAPRGIQKIVERNSGKQYWSAQRWPVQAMDPEVARKVNSILSDNAARTPVFGPKSPLAFEGRSVAAKTGTTQEFRDAWTVGYAPSLAVGVWVGNNDGKLMKPGADGVFAAAPIWSRYMHWALDRLPQESFLAYYSEKESKMVSSNLASAPIRESDIDYSKRPKGWSRKEWRRHLMGG